MDIGRFVTVSAVEDPEMVCLGTGLYMDVYIERLFEFFEAAVPADFTVPVNIVTGSACTKLDRIACYDPETRSVYAESFDSLGYRTLGVLRHEVTHAVVHALWGRSVPFFEEGIAEALSRSIPGSIGPSEGSVSVLGMVDAAAEDVDYMVAARFSRFLIDAHGLARYRQMFQGSPQGSSRGEIVQLFGEVYGKSLTELEAEFSEQSRCAYQMDVCAAPIEAVSLSWAASVAVSCEDPFMYGASWGSMGRQWTLSISHGGRYRLQASVPVVIERCGACQAQATQGFSTDVEVDLQPGVYNLEVSFNGGAHDTVQLELLSTLLDRTSG